MPVYNEGGTVGEVLDCVLAQACVAEVVVVDDCSEDETWQALSQKAAADPRIRIFRHSRNLGKGAALRTAFAEVNSPIVLIQDADREYSPECYDALIGPILRNQADVVFGSRFLGVDARRVLYFWHSLGNRVLTVLSNMATDLNLTDMETCFKVFRIEFLRRLSLQEDRFGIEPEITAKIARLRPRIYEIGVPYHGRTYDEGKKITWRDGVRAIWCIVKYRFWN